MDDQAESSTPGVEGKRLRKETKRKGVATVAGSRKSAKAATASGAAKRAKAAAGSKSVKPAKSVKSVKSAGAGKVRAAREGHGVTPSFEEIQLRAYFISERRRQQGLPGDDTGDWVEAERQLVEEATFGRRGAKGRSGE